VTGLLLQLNEETKSITRWMRM